MRRLLLRSFALLLVLCLMFTLFACENAEDVESSFTAGKRLLLPNEAVFHPTSDTYFKFNASYNWTENGCVITTQPITLSTELRNGQTIEQKGREEFNYSFDESSKTISLILKQIYEGGREKDRGNLVYELSDNYCIKRITIAGIDGDDKMVLTVTNADNNSIDFTVDYTERSKTETFESFATIDKDNHKITWNPTDDINVTYVYNDDGYIWSSDYTVKSEYDNGGNLISLTNEEEYGILSVTYSDTELLQPWQNLIELLSFNSLGYLVNLDGGEDSLLLPIFTSFINAQ